ncbi:P-type conjugative transfer protein TrbJ [Paraburkholderia fungorum]|jgi:P-type conjugative transfer protein TrbJ|uniref:type VI secretion protein n=1 Tax=Paraburkholderia fungorum TaxID=134537 RepID=UPI0016158236|nr:type VI secretion protein [Paraburkholderia fungorum]MBB4518195.1 P-type conjugative transfer protein TrbJ [Paraburkholderia fungorum]
MKKILARLSLTVGMTLFASQAAQAQLAVIDPSNLIQNTITALKSVKTEVYQDSNIAYQYQMMANQLLQAVNLDPAAMKAQYDQITGDISKYKQLADNATSLYGDLQNGNQWLSHVQTMISRSGKSNAQWFADMGTLYTQRDSQATQLMQTGNNVLTHIQTLAQRRQDLQSQMSLTPTAQATAELTTHYLDIVSSQMSDLLQMTAGKVQKDAQQQSVDNEEDKTRSANAKAFLDQQAAERAAYGN